MPRKPIPPRNRYPIKIATVTTNDAPEILLDGVDEDHLSTDTDAEYLVVRVDDLLCDHDEEPPAGWDVYVRPGRPVCPACLREALAGPRVRVAEVWGSVIVPEDADVPLRVPVLPAGDTPEEADGTPGGRPDLTSRAPERVRDLLWRLDALAGSDPASPWHLAALALRAHEVAGPLGAAHAAVRALEALAAHAEHRRAYGGAA